MSEYIEREAALDIVNGWRDQLIPTYGKNDEYVKCLETVAEHLELLIAADVRPVVMCKDCRHRDPEDHKCDCGQLERAGCVFPVDDDYFCSYGEKREEA